MATQPTAITFVVPGQRQVSRSAATGAPADNGLPGRVKDAVRVSSRRAGGESVRVSAVPGEDVVLLRIAGGPALLLHPETARDLMLGQGTVKRSSAPAASDDVVVPAQLRWQGLEQAAPTRSGGFLGNVVLAAFEVITDLVKDKAVGWVADKVVAKVDGQVEAGVYELQADSLSALKGSGLKRTQLPALTDAPNQPLLVLIHGTFVDTFSTFGKLWAMHRPRVNELFAHYGNRVYALDHPTVGVSPISNALTLVQAMPQGARLHLVTHSRGGLVAEVLAVVCGRMASKQPIGNDDYAFFDGSEHDDTRKALKALAAAVKAKGIQVDRVVRVACPARGTLLASKRLDAYLSVLRWTIELAGVPVVPALVDFLTEVARCRADATKLPGLASMIPDTPLVDWLNANEEPIPGDLRVVAGDLQGDSVGSWVKTLLADAYYWTDNDIVVQTSSMYGGAARSGGATFLLDQSGKSTHFNYFANVRTVQAVVEGLTQTSPAGFRTIGPLSWAGKDSSGLRAARRSSDDGRPASDKPAVFVLPGILGSHLKAGDKRIWLSLRLVGGLKKLAYQPDGVDGVTPDGPIGLIYDDLIEHLQQSHAVLPFAFDWRRPIEEEANRLADAVERELDARSGSGQPVRIIAHSMGGVLTRTMQIVRPKTFERLMKREGARLLMLGTPNGGSWAPMQCLSGDDTFGNALASFGSPLRNRHARQLMAQMPGFIQLQADLLDVKLGLDREETWADLARRDLLAVQEANWWHRSAGEAGDAAYEWGVPPQQVLNQARALREKLDAQLDPQRGGVLRAHASNILLVVGKAKFTPDGYEWGSEGFVYLNATDGGDGRVPLAKALLPGVRTWTVDSEHGSLPDVGKAFEAYVELLSQGDTQKLPRLQVEGAQRGGAAAKAIVHVRSRPSRTRPSALPAGSERQVMEASAGVPSGPADHSGTPPLKVNVLNGNLSFVRGTLMVGHSRALQLSGTEYVINKLVSGAMQDALDAGLYPDQPGSHQLFVNDSAYPDNPWKAPQPASVVVVGLGAEGKLTERELTRTVRQGVLAWVQRMAEGSLPAHTQGSAPQPQAPLTLTATLMGSGGAGFQGGNSARAIALGVRQANQRLASVARAGWPQVGELTLVELYLERASDAWRGLQMLASSAPEEFDVAPTVTSGVGPLRRQMDSGYRGTDYDFITATGGRDKNVITFRLDTKRARTEVNAQSTQGRLLRELVRRASTEANTDPQLGRTLFQLLVPVEVEPFLAGTSRMVLELDDQTAAIPWELLDTRGDEPQQKDEIPWSIRTKLLRKLQTENFRQHVQDAKSDDAVLVIGEPKVDMELYVSLPGARAEAESVRDALLGSGGLAAERVKALIDDNDATTIINALFEQNYRIVHIAGHGEPVKRDDKGQLVDLGGVVLSEGTFLGPHEIRAMRTVPELVFVNCCHLAARDADQTLRGGTAYKDNFNRAEFAMGVADALISIGVRCVIAAGWAVDDVPAKVFAETFYRAILGRQPFIDAVALAREAAWKDNRDSNTWAAYQAYGDPDWVYRRGPHDNMVVQRHNTDEFDGISSPLGLALALEEQAVRVRWMHADQVEQREKVSHLEARFGDLWGGMGAVAEAFGLAYAEGGDRDSAIRWYERALQANDGSASMKAHEQLGNLQARRAWGKAQKAKPGTPAMAAARQEISNALRSLLALAGLQPTLERHSLCGSAYKRLAMLERREGDAAAEQAALVMAATCYARAEKMARATEAPDLFYPALNRMALELVAERNNSSWKGFDADATAAARRSLLDKSQQDPDFWCYAGLVEIDVYEAVAAKQLGTQVADLLARYAELHGRVSSVQTWGSVADNAALVLLPYLGTAKGAEKAAAQQLLDVLNGYAKGE
ncbi:MAG: CHAT domain-containing protein [Rubrivivax sp.]|nr:CHAT domain-containing protein [Rubrivivax sp.]